MPADLTRPTALDAMLDSDHPIKRAAAEWAATNLTSAGVIDRELWAIAAERGIQGAMMPIALGGTDSNAVHTVLEFEGLGRGTANSGVVFGLNAQVIALQRALLLSASETQKDRWLRPLIAGKIFGAFAMTEPMAGSDIASITTTAIEQPDGSFVLNGTKAWATLGPICDMAVIFATTDPNKGSWGITAFIVEATLEGFDRGPDIERIGLGGCPVGELRLRDCRVGADAVLGRVGSGGAIFSRVVDLERAFLYAAKLGAMERLIDLSIERARARQQAGTNIGSFQAVAHRIVDMKLHHEAARLLVYKAAALADRGDSISLAAALAKLQTAERSVDVALDALRVFGAMGFTTEAGIGQELGDAVGGLSFSGTPDVTRNIVAAHLKLGRSTAEQ